MEGVLLPICSIFFSALLCVAFFVKKRINLLENNLYSIMLIASFIDNKKLVFVCPKKDLYGIYLEEQDKLYLERANESLFLKEKL